MAHEVELLVEEMKRLGAANAEGQISVTFGVLFRDDKCANLFEALVGTLRQVQLPHLLCSPRWGIPSCSL